MHYLVLAHAIYLALFVKRTEIALQPKSQTEPARELPLYAYCAHPRSVEGPPPGLFSKSIASVAANAARICWLTNSQNTTRASISSIMIESVMIERTDHGSMERSLVRRHCFFCYGR